jgi:hypothetical protein
MIKYCLCRCRWSVQDASRLEGEGLGAPQGGIEG